jgi:predicted nucleic-acid-binding protein
LRITVDTNVLVRVLTEDDPIQAGVARDLLERADLVAVPLPVLCELVWVLRSGYRKSTTDVVDALSGLMEIEKILMDRPACEAGLAVLRSGGDFADGVIAHQGASLGSEIFASFDRAALVKLRALGVAAAEPAALISQA